ncbi:hypothetical protein [Sulfurimonas hydrogeniphila]|uniref:hypothetical protein n=1 Tax=Sulfurimonas hydrogeniphila TaxID=2509341 RepID=UPI00125F1A36|nr:hypothetical protein [Sulfurimonas hydrogeniphila]
MIGIFWIYNSKIYFKTVKIDAVKVINGFIDSNFSHYQVWDEISLQNKDFYLYEYEEVPRGRVVYDVDNKQYIVYSNEDIINSNESKSFIINAFDLSSANVLFEYDAHYEIICNGHR